MRQETINKVISIHFEYRTARYNNQHCRIKRLSWTMCPCISHINMLRSIRRCAMSNLVNEMLCRATPIKYNNKNYYTGPNYDIGNGNSRQNCNYHNHHHHLQNGEFRYCFRRLNSISNPFFYRP